MAGEEGESVADAETPVLWCRKCDGPGERRDGKFVHAATGQAEGPDGHQADPTVTGPERRAEARAIAAEFGGKWEVAAWLGIFRAVPAGVTAPVPLEARTGGELREKIKAQERLWALQRRGLELS